MIYVSYYEYCKPERPCGKVAPTIFNFGGCPSGIGPGRIHGPTALRSITLHKRGGSYRAVIQFGSIVFPTSILNRRLA